MRLITISRQFGSGGRELGRRLAEKLGYDFYDKNILAMIGEQAGVDAEYVKNMLHRNDWSMVPHMMEGSFMTVGSGPRSQVSLLQRQRDLLMEIAKLDRDAIIVGRDADIILEEFKPFRIYACADMEFRLQRCLKREQEEKETDRLTEKEIRKNIKRIDKQRMQTREILTGKGREDTSVFEVVINTGSWQMDKLTESIAKMATDWFEQR